MRRPQSGTVVGIRAVLKPKRLRYQPAYMLQYESIGQQKHASYVFVGLNGEQDTASEAEFNAKKGPARISHLVPMLPDSSLKPQAIVADFLTEKQYSTIPLSGLTEQADLKAKIEAIENSMMGEPVTVSVAPQTLADRIAARREAKVAPVSATSRTAELREKNSLLEEKLQQLRDELAECPYQMLATHECAKALRDAMAKAKHRLMIVSAFLSSQVVNENFIQRLEDCLKRGVEVWIGFGFGDKAKRSQFHWSHAEDALKDLRRKFKKSMFLHDFKNSHEKLLIKDDEYVVVGSYNWLSFEQERGASYRRENALLVKDPRVISEHWDEFSRVMKPESKTES